MVHIPDYFPQWLADMVLGHFPEGDPEAMRRAADAWSDAANELVLVVARVQAALSRLETAVEGATGAAIREQYGKVIAHTEAQIDFGNAVARHLYDNATAIECQQYVIIGIAGALLAQMTIDMAMPPPGSIVKAVADRAQARAGMELAKRDVVLSILTNSARFVAEYPRFTLAAKGVFFGTVVGGGVPYVAQRVQIAQGHREMVDWRQVGIGAAAGAVGGLAGVEVGRRVAPAVIRAGGRVLGAVAAGGVGGMAGGLAGGLTAYGSTGGELRGKDLAAMVWTGFGSGVVGSSGAGARAGGIGASTGAPEPVASLDVGGPADAVSLLRVSAAGDGQPPHTHTATPVGVSTTGRAEPPPASRPEAGPGDGSAEWDLPDAVRAEGDQIARDFVNGLREGPERDAALAFLRGDGPRQLPDGSGGIPALGIAPDHPSGGLPHPSSPSSPRRGGSWPAWDHTAAARAGSSVAVSTPSEAGLVTTIPARQFQISDPQVRPDQRVIVALTEGTVTQPAIPAPGIEILDDGSSSYAETFMIEHGPAGEMYLLAGARTEVIASPDATALPPGGGTSNDGATVHEEQSLLHLDFVAEDAGAELASSSRRPGAVYFTAPSVEVPHHVVGTSTSPSAHVGTDATVAGHAQSVPEALPLQPAAAAARGTTYFPESTSPEGSATPSGVYGPESVSQYGRPPALAAFSDSGTNVTDGPGIGHRPLGAVSMPQPGDGADLPAEPPEFDLPQAPLFPAVLPGYVPDPTTPVVPEYPERTPREYEPPLGDHVAIPGRDVPRPQVPPNAMPVIPHLPTEMPTNRTAAPPRYHPSVSIPDPNLSDAHDDLNDTPRPLPEVSLPPRHQATPHTRLPALSPSSDEEAVIPHRCATPVDPSIPGAPHDPTRRPTVHPDSLDYITHDSVPDRNHLSRQLVPSPGDQVVPRRPVPRAHASPITDPDEPGRDKTRGQQEAPGPSTPWSRSRQRFAAEKAPTATNDGHGGIGPFQDPAGVSDRPDPRPARTIVTPDHHLPFTAEDLAALNEVLAERDQMVRRPPLSCARWMTRLRLWSMAREGSMSRP
ncbi:hypothetical protein ACRS6B_13905 [Nocardia asteroides]